MSDRHITETEVAEIVKLGIDVRTGCEFDVDPTYSDIEENFDVVHHETKDC